ncbi:MAG TPA: hypothetical protein VFO64_06115 [Gaiellaceae bacterium]|nr:hypothetical protein [Gaiellaceae bacterium]
MREPELDDDRVLGARRERLDRRAFPRMPVGVTHEDDERPADEGEIVRRGRELVAAKHGIGKRLREPFARKLCEPAGGHPHLGDELDDE